MNENFSPEQRKVVNEAKGLAKWLSVDFTIKIFGVTLIEFHFPPQSSN